MTSATQIDPYPDARRASQSDRRVSRCATGWRAGLSLLVLAAAPRHPVQPIPIPPTPAIADAADPTAAPATVPDRRVRATIVPGEAPMPVPPGAVTITPERGTISLNFPAADVRVVAKSVLRDLLHLNYTVAQSVSGAMTLVTPGPVARSALLPLFETALRNADLGLVSVAGGYEIQTLAAARAPVADDATGYGTETIALKFINADEVRKIIDSALPGVVLSTDPGSNALTIAGTTGQRASARDLLRQFDVDWLRNTSFALYVPQRSDARLIAPELDKLINASDAPTRGLVRLIAMERLNGILAISAQPRYLDDVRRWVEILDREGESAEPRIYVYRVQNGRSRDLARTINAAFGIGGDTGPLPGDDPFGESGQRGGTSLATPAPTDAQGPDRSTTTGSFLQPPGQAAATAPRTGSAASSGQPAVAGNGAIGARITSDEVNNAVIVYGTPREYAVVEDALRRLDLPPQQVLIEAAITEVTLNDSLQYGVQWNYANGNTNVGYSEGGTSTPTRIFPGLSFFYGGNSITATLNALEQRTNIKVISAPKLLVLNNQTAALQVGDQVPIATGTATNLNSGTGANAIVSTIEYRDTGVILKVTPRVNASGLVQLDVSQEVSDVSATPGSANTQTQSPTISTRRIATTVAVQDQQVIALGGLFRNSVTYTKTGIPILSRIPIIGGLFGTQGHDERRTELIVLLKPHVLQNVDDGRAITEELRAKLRTLEPFRTQGRIP